MDSYHICEFISEHGGTHEIVCSFQSLEMEDTFEFGEGGVDGE
jgi:hypothetical protein